MCESKNICERCYGNCDGINQVHYSPSYFLDIFLNPWQTLRLIRKNRKNKNVYTNNFNYLEWIGFWYGFFGFKKFMLTLIFSFCNFITFQEIKDFQYVLIVKGILKMRPQSCNICEMRGTGCYS